MPPPAPIRPPTAFADIVSARFSCRAFTPTPVPHADICQILTLAGQAASWCNVQPWHVYMLSGAPLEALRRDLMAQSPQEQGDIALPARYEGVYRDRRRAAGFQLYETLGIARDDHAARAAQSARNFALFDAPHLAVLCAERALGPYGLLDCGGFLAQFLLAAQSLGIATIAQGAIARQSDLLRRHLPVPDTQDILCGISFGYPSPLPVNRFRTARADLDAFVTWQS